MGKTPADRYGPSRSALVVHCSAISQANLSLNNRRGYIYSGMASARSRGKTQRLRLTGMCPQLLLTSEGTLPPTPVLRFARSPSNSGVASGAAPAGHARPLRTAPRGSRGLSHGPEEPPSSGLLGGGGRRYCQDYGGKRNDAKGPRVWAKPKGLTPQTGSIPGPARFRRRIFEARHSPNSPPQPGAEFLLSNLTTNPSNQNQSHSGRALLAAPLPKGVVSLSSPPAKQSPAAPILPGRGAR